MHNALCASHIYLLDSSSYYFFLVFCILSYSSVSLLECSFKIRLYSLVSHCLSANNLDSLLSGFNVWHTDTSLILYKFALICTSYPQTERKCGKPFKQAL